MKKLVSNSLVAAVIAASAVVAAPAQAQPEHPCWLHAQTAGELWLCLCGEMAGALSPVIPPETWSCGWPDLPPHGGS